MSDINEKRKIKIMTTGPINVDGYYLYGPVLTPFDEKIAVIRDLVNNDISVIICDITGEHQLNGSNFAEIVNSTTEPIPMGCATDECNGLMSQKDKLKLDAIAKEADNVSYTSTLLSGIKIGTITVNETDYDIFIPNSDTAQLQLEINNKVDKVEGKGLSTNDFTNEHKELLDNLFTEVYSKETMDAIIANIDDTEGLHTVLEEITSRITTLENELIDVDELIGTGVIV